jgi:membrane complex biogenesis BtpA family protein
MPQKLLAHERLVIGMIHLRALPGTPGNTLPVGDIIQEACREAEIYQTLGVEALLIENMHDRPYLRSEVGPEVVASMTAAAQAVRSLFEGPIGVQVLAGANDAALAVALGAGLDFIRVEGFVFAHIADEGLIQGCAGELLRKRKAWGAESVKVFTDIKKKHSSHAITADVDLAETAKAAEFFGSDGLIVSGVSTGAPVDLVELRSVSEVAKSPILTGSGATPSDVNELFEYASGVIVGSYFKVDGRWENPIDPTRVREFVKKAKGG